MLGTLRNLITSSMCRSGLGCGRAKSTVGLVAASFFRWGHRGARSLNACAKYATAVMPLRSLAAGEGDDEDAGAGSGTEGKDGPQARLQWRSLVS